MNITPHPQYDITLFIQLMYSPHLPTQLLIHPFLSCHHRYPTLCNINPMVFAKVIVPSVIPLYYLPLLTLPTPLHYQPGGRVSGR